MVVVGFVVIGLAVVVVCVVVNGCVAAVNEVVTVSSFSPGRYAPLDKLLEAAKNCDQ